MATITTRSGKGSPLTNTEVDNNFTNLNTDKVEKSGDTLTGDLAFGDNVKAKFGASNDLEIYHDGSNTFINDQGTGDLIIVADNLRLRGTNGEQYILGNANAEVQIRYDGVTKFQTTSSGVDVTGTVVADGIDLAAGSNISSLGGLTLTLDSDNSSSNTYFEINADGTNKSIARFREDGDIYFYEDTGTTAKLTWDASAEELQFKDNVKAEFGDGGDLQIYANSGFSYIDETGAGNLNLRTNGANIGIYDTANSQYMARFTTGGDAELYYNGSEKLATTSTGIDVTGTVTADGLTVEGAVTQKVSGNATLKVHADTDTSPVASLELQRGANDTWGADVYTDYRFRDEVGDLFIEQGSSGNTVALMKLGDNSDISFYADDGSSQDLYWDASTSRLGLGTTSPSYTLDVSGSTPTIRIRSSSNNDTSLLDMRTVAAYSNESKSIIKLGSPSTGSVNDNEAKAWHIEASEDESGFPQRGYALKFIQDERIDASTTQEVEAMRLTSDGRLGIGTTSPSNPLHVYHATTDTVANFESGDSAVRVNLTASDNSMNIQTSGTDGIIKNDGAGNFRLFNNGSERMRIDSSGRVGIGTTTLTRALNVHGSMQLSGIDTTVNTGNAAMRRGSGGEMFLDAPGHIIANIDTNNNNTDRYFGVQKDTNTELFRVQENGNVGIGTTSPSSKLQIQAGDLNVGGNDSSNPFSKIRLGASQYGACDIVPTDESNHKIGMAFYVDGTQDTTINPTEAMRIDSSGNVGIGISNPSAQLHLSQAGGTLMKLGTSQNTCEIEARESGAANILVFSSNNSVDHMAITDGGKVGIGTTSPATVLHVENGATSYTWTPNARTAAIIEGNNASGTTLSIIGKSTGYSGIFFGDEAYEPDGQINYDHTASAMRFATAGGEKARIDSSGNLLVGTTDSTLYNSTSDTGIAQLPLGKIEIARSGGTLLTLNRLSSDGTIQEFRKDGTTIGSIGTFSNDAYIATNDTGLRFIDSVEAITPFNGTTVTNRDAAISLGLSSYRFTDLYLSGGVYLGGTGSANLLDDYEEGTWTPVAQKETGGTITATYSTQSGTYTKIGRLVYFTCDMNISSVTSQGTGAPRITGLPFSAGGGYRDICSVYGTALNTTDVITQSYARSNVLYFGIDRNTTFPPVSYDWQSGVMRISGCYYIP